MVGGVNVDVHTHVIEHPDDDREVAWGDEGRMSPGGRAANVAVTATRLGRKFVELVGCVGDDMLGESVLTSLKAENVSTRLVNRLEGAVTGIRQVVIDSKGATRSIGSANANWHCGENQIRKADTTIFGADTVYVTLEIPMPSVRRVIATAASRDVPVILDATPLPTPAGLETIDRKVLSHVDVLLTNWSSAQRLAQMSASGPMAVELSKELLRMGPKAVVVTMGEHGALIAIRGQHALVEAARVQLVDQVGAGDVFAGSLVVALTSQSRGNWTWDRIFNATRFASAAAGIAVSRPGGRESFPNRLEVERRLNSEP